MPENKKTDYLVSTILEHDASFDLVDVFAHWLETQENTTGINFDKDSLLNNPVFRFINPGGETIKIDDIRNFNQELSFSNYSDQTRYFIFFNFDQATLQAQNASLKSIEEPPKDTHIVLMTTTVDKLLPTITSRCKLISHKKPQSQQEHLAETAKIYQQIAQSKHYELIELANNYKDREGAIKLLENLLEFLNYQLHKNTNSQSKRIFASQLQIILKNIERLNQNTNVRLTLENCFFDLIK